MSAQKKIVAGRHHLKLDRLNLEHATFSTRKEIVTNLRVGGRRGSLVYIGASYKGRYAPRVSYHRIENMDVIIKSSRRILNPIGYTVELLGPVAECLLFRKGLRYVDLSLCRQGEKWYTDTGSARLERCGRREAQAIDNKTVKPKKALFVMIGSGNGGGKGGTNESNRSYWIVAEEPEGDTYSQEDDDDNDDEDNP